MVQVKPTVFPRSSKQRNSVTVAGNMEGNTTPTIHVTVSVTMPMGLQVRSSDPASPPPTEVRKVRINPIRNWERTNS
jgi:hypothetical protein